MLSENLRYFFWIILAILIGYFAYANSSKPVDYFSVYIGFLLSFLGIYVSGYFTRPNIKICLGSEDDAPNGSLRFVHVNVLNLDNPKWFFIFRRKPAEYCKARLTFKKIDSNNAELIILGRWSSKGEPITPDGKVDFSKFPEGTSITITPSRSLEDLTEGKLGLAVKFNNENECYGFNDWSYAYNFKHPQFKLNRGKYRITVEILIGTYIFQRTFMLDNSSVDIDKFKLSSFELSC